MTSADPPGVHAAWLPPEAFRAIGARRVRVHGTGRLVETVLQEVRQACARYGGAVRHSGARPAAAYVNGADANRGYANGADVGSGYVNGPEAKVAGAADGEAAGAEAGPPDLVLALATAEDLPAEAAAIRAELRWSRLRRTEPPGTEPPGAERPGAEPPRAGRSGAQPPGAEPPGAGRSGAEPLGAGRSGAERLGTGPYRSGPNGVRPSETGSHGAEPLMAGPHAAEPSSVRPHGAEPAEAGPYGNESAENRPGWGGADTSALGAEGFALARRDGVTVVLADAPAGLLYGLFHLVRLGEAAFGAERPVERHRPALRQRMLDHWDNVAVHPVMGQVERGYAGGSIFWRDGALTSDLGRVRAYARLLAAIGVNAVAVNNVNVHATEARLLTDRLGDVAALAYELRPYGVRVHLAVDFAAPLTVGGLPTADPLDARVRAWWAAVTRRVYDMIPDFGGYLVKADSEGRPGPMGYGRDHADGANLLAEALAPYGGVVHWRAFVYDHRQDWRDRSTDRARAAYDHFTPLDGRFRDNVILQVKHGPMDFQVREPVSPVLAAMPATRLAVEFQITQEYTGQQRHVCYLAPMWREVLGFGPWGPEGRTVAEIAAGGGLVAVSNVGDDPFWTGHPLAQANLYAFGRLAWDPGLDPAAVLDEWIDLTFTPAATGDPELLRRTLHLVMDESWRTYEQYTAPLGVGFMVRPGSHYGPDVDGYEYTPWGTYHFADRDGVGVDRTRATGTGFTGQYPPPWSEIYESLDRCPDELLLFFHHVPYGHVLHSGSTVIQHIYDTHFAGVARVAEMRERWRRLGEAGLVDPALDARVRERFDEQLRSAEEWRDQINTYFFRKSGVPDAKGRRIH